MTVKSYFVKLIARQIVQKTKRWSNRPIETQNKVFKQLITQGRQTIFGKNHDFSSIETYEDFKKRVPIRDYEGLRYYVEQVLEGKENILWPGKPLYLCKTSGTTSGVKYIPLTKASLPNHINTTRNALLSYIHATGKSDFVNGKMIFLQGSPELDEKSGIKVGRLSGIVAHHVPRYLQKNRMPSYKTNCIKDWETKVDTIVDETIKENMTLISGIPSWVQMYFEKLSEKAGGKPISEIFPNFSLFVYGGVNYEPYRTHFEKLIGKRIDSVQLYPASEGFIAFQDQPDEKGLLLVLNEGIFYEFISVDEFFNDNPTRITLKDVKIGVNYVIILNTNAGLWGYNLGDTVKFVNDKPYRLIVTGRIKHFISAFGEHVIAEEVEGSMEETIKKFSAEVKDFTVAPQINPKDGELPYHEWFIEFAKEPKNLLEFAKSLDELMVQKNTYYRDLIEGNILQTLKISVVKKGGFNAYMESIGRLGSQNKVPRLGNDRQIAECLAVLRTQN